VKKTLLFIPLALLIAGAVWYFKFPSPSFKGFRKNKVTTTVVDSTRIRIAHALDTFFTNRSIENGFSGSVLVAWKGEPVYEKCFGYCNYRNKDLMQDTAAFQLASVSKTFTATAVLYLIEQNKLSLTDTLQKFFPGLPYKGITVQQLLCHRSGLPNYLYFASGLCSKKDYLSNDDIIAMMVQKKPALYAKANRKFEYCNTNYLLLASIVEKVSGKSFGAFMRETFFVPLGMNRTFVYDHTDSTNRKIAISYNSKWQIQADDCFDGVVGDKGIYSTVHDMFLWDKAFYDGNLLSQEMMKEAYSPRSFEKPGVRNYGYGWRLIQKPDSSYLVYHNGWWHGNNTVFYRNVQDTAAIIILSNKFNRYVYNVKPVWEIIYGAKSDGADVNEEE
jgi:CubicO group peptidase (beta-lactamase class C family)